MPSKKIVMKIKALSIAVASSLLLYSGAEAAGLGKLTVLSALGQPLRAEIELTSVTKDDIGNLAPRLANLETFRQAKVDFNPVLSSLRFDIEERGSRQFVLITSPQAINEPFLEVLVELTSASGRLVRDYSLLLDPAELNGNPKAARVEEKLAGAKPNVLIQRAVTKPSFKLENKPAAPQPQSESEHYQIKEGDTLGKIADQFKAQGVSLDQMLVALQRINPSALINNNVNLIRAGKILTIPTPDEVKRINASEAAKIVSAQSTDFNAYRNKLADQADQIQTEEDVNTKKIDSGKITSKIIETPTAINEAEDKLKLSKEPLPEQAAPKVSEEEKIAKQNALAEASTRLKELEQNTAKLQEMLDLQSQEATKNTPSAALPAVQANIVTPETQPFWKDWIAYLPYGAALLLALLGAIYLGKRKKTNKQTHFLKLDTNSHDEPIIGNNLLYSPEMTTRVNLAHEEEVDPVARAEIYRAYGHDEQAEETLIEALHVQPDHHLARLKLLEIYVHRKDTRSFETIARQLHEITEGVGAEWEQAAAMGLTLDPQNPFYASKKVMPMPSSVLSMATEINQTMDDVLQPANEIKTDKDIALDFSFSTPPQEKLVQVETKADQATEEPREEDATVTNNVINFDFSGIDLDLPKTSTEVPQEKVKL